MTRHDVPLDARDEHFVASFDDDGALCGLTWSDTPAPLALDLPAAVAAAASRLREQLSAYLAGDDVAFDVPLRPVGTPFQQQVWSALRRIPFGATVSYGDLARELGRPGGARAVGQANGANPIPIVIPCHRVVARHGLGGFSGGLHRKERLLALENHLLL